MDDIITAHKKVEQALLHLTAVAEHSNEGVALIDLDGAVRFVNTAWAAMHGCNGCDQLVGKQFSIFHTEKQMETDVVPLIEETKRRGRLEGPVEHVKSDGTVFPTLTKLVAVKNQHDEPLGLIVFAADMSEQERTRQQLRQYRTQLESVLNQHNCRPQAPDADCPPESDRSHPPRAVTPEYSHMQQQFDRQAAELKQANEQLQSEITRREHSEQCIVLLEEKLQNITSIIHKHL